MTMLLHMLFYFWLLYRLKGTDMLLHRVKIVANFKEMLKSALTLQFYFMSIKNVFYLMFPN